MSHKLLVRAGFVRQLTSGVYSLLPLGWRVCRKISNLVRREMDAIGGQEFSLPALHPAEIPLLRERPGITFKEIADHLGISPQAAAREIPEALMLCGVPPYMPHDYIACYTEEDRVTVRFADHFKRPARITLGEAAALLLALRAVPPARVTELPSTSIADVPVPRETSR